MPLDEVTPEMRRRAKTANFGIIYGISAWGLAERLKISRKEGKELIDGYFNLYPGVKRYMEESVEKARKQGYVETIMGRRRYLRDINSSKCRGSRCGGKKCRKCPDTRLCCGYNQEGDDLYPSKN